MDEISRQYNQLLDEGASITELYVYHLIVNDERNFGMSEKEIIEMVRDAIDKRYSSTQGIEYIVDSLLNGDELDGDEDEWY
jgi:hypothetical protein